MRYFIRFVLLAAFVLAIFLFLPRSATASETNREIDYLLAEVRRSPSLFVRNGQEYTGIPAAEHLAAKRDYFRKNINTAEDFIRLAATKSALSGTSYIIRHRDGTEELSAAWLTRLLHQFRAEHP